MKKGLIISFVLIVCITAGIIWKKTGLRNAKEKDYQVELSEDNETPENRAEMIGARLQYEYDLIKDPKTGKIPANIFREEMAQAKSLPIAGTRQ